jgi:hypothetical protein
MSRVLFFPYFSLALVTSETGGGYALPPESGNSQGRWRPIAARTSPLCLFKVLVCQAFDGDQTTVFRPL